MFIVSTNLQNLLLNKIKYSPKILFYTLTLNLEKLRIKVYFNIIVDYFIKLCENGQQICKLCISGLKPQLLPRVLF